MFTEAKIGLSEILAANPDKVSDGLKIEGVRLRKLHQSRVGCVKWGVLKIEETPIQVKSLILNGAKLSPLKTLELF